MKKNWIHILMLSMAFVLAACSPGVSEGTSSESSGGGSTASAGGTVNYIAPVELVTLDSTMVSDMNSANYISHFQDGLYWEDENNNVVPALAADLPEVSDDGLVYTIKMREDATWSNGDPVTAHDTVFALRRLADPEQAAPYQFLMEGIENGLEVMSGDLPVEELAVTALDDYTVEIRLNQPNLQFPNMLAFPTLYPLNEAYVTEQGEAYASTTDHLLSNGPYIIGDWTGSEQSWSLAKNPDYYAADEVAIENIDVQVLKEVNTAVNLYESGQVDNAPLSGELAKQYVDHPDAVVQEKSRSYWIRFNEDLEELDNLALRQAMDYAIDNQAIADQVLGNGSLPLTSFIPTNFVSNPETGADFQEDLDLDSKYDEARAQELWDQAKSEMGIDSLTLTLTTDDEEHIKKIAEYIQGQFQVAMPGLTVEIQSVPKKNRLELEQSRDFDIILSSWAADFATPINFLETYVSDSHYNRGGYNNEAFDQLVNDSKSVDATDEQQIWENSLNAVRIMEEDMALIPLYQEVELQLRNPNLQNITFRPVGNEFDLRTAHFTE